MALTFIDAVGAAHSNASPDSRIVSLVPSITELICDLGLAAQLVGRTKWCIHPHEVVETIPTIGGTKKVNLDKLRALAPSHVIVNIDENPREMADAIAEFVPNVIVTHPVDPRDNLELYRFIGGLFGKAEKAESLCGEFDRAFHDLDSVAHGLPERRVLYLIWKDPWMTVASDTYIARTLDLIRWKTIDVGSERYPEIEIDTDLVANLDLVLLSSEPLHFNEGHIQQFSEAFGCPLEKLLLIDGEMTSWYGSRAIRGLDYVRALAQSLATGGK